MSEERRVADDGKIYTKAKFEEWYGVNAEKYFSKAIPVPNSSTPSEQVLHEEADPPEQRATTTERQPGYWKETIGDNRQLRARTPAAQQQPPKASLVLPSTMNSVSDVNPDSSRSAAPKQEIYKEFKAKFENDKQVPVSKQQHVG